jgi:ubiquinone/menaquinone biosynthesis C-methylase UbiE
VVHRSTAHYGWPSIDGNDERFGRQKAIAARFRFMDDRLVPEREDLFAYYAGQSEGQRLLRSAHNRLELLRTRELLQRQLPSPPAMVLDVGGGTGIHATWLASRGYRVHLVDVVPQHVRAAAEHRLVTAEVGDARRLMQADASVDAVLLLGPLYHLVARAERLSALAEARRVLRPGGVLLAAAIGRFMAVLDWAQSGGLTADVAAKLAPVLSTGVHDPTLGFTDAFFHTAVQLQQEVAEVGFADVRVLGIEGPAWTIVDAPGEYADARFDSALRCAQLTENFAEIVDASAHLMALATAP